MLNAFIFTTALWGCFRKDKFKLKKLKCQLFTKKKSFCFWLNSRVSPVNAWRIGCSLEELLAKTVTFAALNSVRCRDFSEPGPAAALCGTVQGCLALQDLLPGCERAPGRVSVCRGESQLAGGHPCC